MFDNILLINNLILGLVIILASVYCYADYVKKPMLKYISKPLATILIILLAFLQPAGDTETYKYLIIFGLFFALIGDVFLMLPSDKFVHGLASFLIAHIFFIIAFADGFGPYYDWEFLIPVIIYSVVFLRILLPKTGKMKAAVFVYSLVLAFFLWQAFGRFYYLAESTAFYTLIGSVLFVVSDSILAYAKFVKQYKISQILIHFSYWGALFLLALSI